MLATSGVRVSFILAFVALGLLRGRAIGAEPGQQAFQDYRFSVWRIQGKDKQTNRYGSAFLIDDRGYFLTASHVLKTGKQGYFSSLTVLLSGDTKDHFEVEVIKDGDLCKDIDAFTRECKEGIDLALIKARKFPEKTYRPLELDLGFPIASSFQGLILGYPLDDSITLVPTGPGSIYPDEASFASDLQLTDGNSGGPVIRLEDPFAAFGVAYRVKVKTGPFPKRFSYFHPVYVDAVYQLLAGSVPVQGDVLELGKKIADNSISATQLVSRIRMMTNIQIVQLVAQLPKDYDQKAARGLYEECSRRRLNREVQRVAPVAFKEGITFTEITKFADLHLSWATVLRAEGRFASAKATAGQAKELYESYLSTQFALKKSSDLARLIVGQELGANPWSLRPDSGLRDLGASSFDMARLREAFQGQFNVNIPDSRVEQVDDVQVGELLGYIQAGSWVGRRNTIAEASLKLSESLALLGDVREATNWAAASYLLSPTPQSAMTLARLAEDLGDYNTSAVLFARAYHSGLAIEPVVQGYQRNTERITTEYKEGDPDQLRSVLDVPIEEFEESPDLKALTQRSVRSFVSEDGADALALVENRGTGGV